MISANLKDVFPAIVGVKHGHLSRKQKPVLFSTSIDPTGQYLILKFDYKIKDGLDHCRSTFKLVLNQRIDISPNRATRTIGEIERIHRRKAPELKQEPLEVLFNYEQLTELLQAKPL